MRPRVFDLDSGGILKRYKSIAIVGLSRNEDKYSHIVAKFMMSAGYMIIPVNPSAEGKILGKRVYRNLNGLKDKLEMVDVFRPDTEALEITKSAVINGAKVVWLQEGIVNEEAKRYAESHNVMFIQDKCIMKEYIRMAEIDGP